MCRSAADRKRRRGVAILLATIAAGGASLAAAAPPATAAAPVAELPVAGFELTHSVELELHRMQESWLQWVSAFYQSSSPRADAALSELTATASQLGAHRLADLSLGASARAVQSAYEGNFARADAALAAAETLDSERADTAFARAAVEWQRGRWGASLRARLDGWSRLLASSTRETIGLDMALFALAVLLLAGALFVVVEIAVKGSALVLDTHRFFAHRLSPVAAGFVTTAVLLWPLALPGRWLWLLLFGSALLWGYCSPSERVVFVAIWAIAAAAPYAGDRISRRVALTQSPPIRAVSNFAEGRLYGAFFADLEVLKSLLPKEPAALQLLGDVHRSLGQWELARLYYRQVLELENDNVPALLDVGAYYFRKGDFNLAIQYFQRAARQNPPWAAAYFNLNLAYGESYQFNESRKALADARAVDPTAVDRWIKNGAQGADRVVTYEGGLLRRGEIQNRLAATWAEKAPASLGALAGVRRFLGLASAIGAALLAIGLHALRRRRGYGEPVPWLPWHGGGVERWLHAIFPPVWSVEMGEGFAAFGVLLLLVALGMLPIGSRFAVDLPLGSRPWEGFSWIAAAAGLLVYLGVRIARELRSESEA